MHLAIIMDGNGRWSEKRGLTRLNGHKAGSETLTEIALYCAKKEIAYLTVYAFSVQNWGRPKDEINGLFYLIRLYFGDVDLFLTANIRIKIQGYINIYPAEILDVLTSAVNITKNNTGMVLTIALSYGGQEEIVQAVNKIIQAGHKTISTKTLATYIDKETPPPPDLVIRTSGEFRTSNFLLWQSAYSEYLFLDIYWPEFTEEHIDQAIEIYAKRSRRFGLTAATTLKKTTRIFPNETLCQTLILDLITPAPAAATAYIDRYKNNTILREKYFSTISMATTTTTHDIDFNFAENITKEIITLYKKLDPELTNNTDEFYSNIYAWFELVFFLIQKKKHIKHTAFFDDFESSDFLTIIDIHQLFCKHVIFTAEEGEQFKKLLINLNNSDIVLYKCVLHHVLQEQEQEQAQEQHAVSAVMQLLYMFLPLMSSLPPNLMCLISTMFYLVDYEKINDNKKEDEILFILNHLIEKIEENNLNIVVDVLITKIKTAFIYFILFRLKSHTKIQNENSMHTLLKYINKML
jgi:undecaprenyl diphosphate synthase